MTRRLIEITGSPRRKNGPDDCGRVLSTLVFGRYAPSGRKESAMAAYAIFEEQILDPSRLEEYKSLSGPSVTKYGGRYLARGGATTSLEGDWNPQRVVVLEFDTVEQAKAWYDSPEYQAARRAREGAMLMKALVIEGV